MKIGIIGLSHQGYIWSIFLSKFYKNIGVFDSQKKRISDFKNKKFPDYIKNEENFELNRGKLIKNVIPKKFSDLKFYDTLLVTEDVVIKNNLSKDNKLLEQNIKEIVDLPASNFRIILMSQVNPGSTRRYFSKVLKNTKSSVFYIPDVLTIGISLRSLENISNFVVGCSNKVASKNEKNFLNNFFTKIDKKFSLLIFEEAELIKEAIQLKLSLDVTFVNLLSSMADKNKISSSKIINFIKKDNRFSKNGYWIPGLGFGGGHIERGLKYFQDNLPINDSNFMNSLINYNELRINWLYDIIDKNKNIKNIFIWGATYKKNTDSIFRSPTLKLITKYKKNFRYTIYDPGVNANSTIFTNNYVTKTNKQFQNLEDFDCLIILSNWDSFNLRKNDLKKFKNYKNFLIIDSFRCLLPIKKDIIKMGIKYIPLGND